MAVDASPGIVEAGGRRFCKLRVRDKSHFGGGGSGATRGLGPRRSQTEPAASGPGVAADREGNGLGSKHPGAKEAKQSRRNRSSAATPLRGTSVPSSTNHTAPFIAVFFLINMSKPNI